MATNDILEGGVSVGVVMVSGPGNYLGSSIRLTDAEKSNIMSETVQGLDFLADYESKADVTFHYSFADVEVDVEKLPEKGKHADAAIAYSDGFGYFFRDKRSGRFNWTAATARGSKLIEDDHSDFDTFDDSFKKNLDAALMATTNGKAYFFKGNEYIRVTPGTGMDSGYPKKIKNNWRKLPGSFDSNFDAAIMVQGTDKVYLGLPQNLWVKPSSIAA